MFQNITYEILHVSKFLILVTVLMNFKIERRNTNISKQKRINLLVQFICLNFKFPKLSKNIIGIQIFRRESNRENIYSDLKNY